MDASFDFVRRIVPETSTSFMVPAASGLLLDSIAPSAAWSFRRLRTAYAGNCCRIRRSSDNAEQDFGFVSDVVDTAGIAAFIGGGSGFVVTWYDQSGNGIDVTQATAGSQPLFVASGITTSLPAARYVAASLNYLGRTSVGVSSLFNLQEATVMSVMEQNGSQARNTLFHWGPDGSAFNRVLCSPTYDDVIYWDFGDAIGGSGRVNVNQPGGWDDAAHVLEFTRTTGDDQSIIVDGATLTTGTGMTAAGPTGTGDLQVGSGLSVDYLDGDMSEVIFFLTDIGSSNRNIVRLTGVGSGVSQGMGPYYGITVI